MNRRSFLKGFATTLPFFSAGAWFGGDEKDILSGVPTADRVSIIHQQLNQLNPVPREQVEYVFLTLRPEQVTSYINLMELRIPKDHDDIEEVWDYEGVKERAGAGKPDLNAEHMREALSDYVLVIPDPSRGEALTLGMINKRHL